MTDTILLVGLCLLSAAYPVGGVLIIRMTNGKAKKQTAPRSAR